MDVVRVEGIANKVICRLVLMLAVSIAWHYQAYDWMPQWIVGVPQKLRSKKIPPNTSDLVFLHIPKTGGTSVESVHAWGMNDPNLAHVARVQSNPCTFWHTPPSVEPKLAKSYAIRGETFCTVRHPLDRFKSEYHYQRGNCDAKIFHNWTVKQLAKTLKQPWHDDCHYFPQTIYVYGEANPNSSARRTYCQQVLRYENLTADFLQLMLKHYVVDGTGKRIRRLPRKNPSENSRCKMNISSETVKLIEKAYASDYDAFGYERSSAHNH